MPHQTAYSLILYLTTALTAPVPTTLTAVEPTATPTSTAVLTTDTAALATETTAQPFNRLSAKHNDSGNNRRAKWDIMGFTYRLTILQFDQCNMLNQSMHWSWSHSAIRKST
jgi:hypothetical protein